MLQKGVVQHLMEILIQSAILCVSLAVVAYSATVLINSVERIEEATGLGGITIGFILLSVITSLPELMVATFSSLGGVAGISVGDILGSNVANIALVLGICILIKPFKVAGKSFEELSEILLLSSLVPLVLTQFMFLNELTGIAMLSIFLFFAYFSTKRKVVLVKRDYPRPKLNKPQIISTLLLGAVGTVLGAKFAVESATAVAQILQVPLVVIGAKVVAIGTSLPELAVDSTAVRRGRYELALGNILGSNLTNLTLVLGTLLIASPPLAVNLTAFSLEVTFVLISSIIIWYFLSKGQLTQREGIVLVFLYVLFQVLL